MTQGPGLTGSVIRTAEVENRTRLGIGESVDLTGLK